MARMVPALAGVAAVLGAFAPSALAAEGDVLVRFAKSADAGERQAARDDAGAELEAVLPLRGLQLVDPEPGVSAEQAIAALEDSPDVLYAEPDQIRTAGAVPNDDFFDLLWGMHNTGQDVNGVTGTPDADVDAPEAWNVNTGSSAVAVAILDSGIDATHPDLASNIWANPGETANGADDDGNGLVDDVRGWDWVPNPDDNDPNDGNGHGTHVSGTVGARGNDSTGVAGVAWDVGLAGLRVLNNSGNGSVSNLIQGYEYADAEGIRVVNASLGATGFSQAERDAIAAASDVLFVVAAGNGGDDGVGDNNDNPNVNLRQYPCSYDLPNVVCVASTDLDDQLSSFSNFGAANVDLAAPGELIASSGTASFCAPDPSPCWAYSDGTSMATPHVAGVAALLLADNPGLSTAQLKAALLGSAEPKPSLAGKTVTGGRLNAFAALTGAPPGTGTGSGSGGGAAAAPTGSAPVTAPAPRKRAAPVDRLAPTLRLWLRRHSLRAVLRRGLRVRVKISEASSVRADLVVGSASAAGKRLRAARLLLMGRKRGSTTKAATITLRVRPSAKARRALRGLRRVSLRLRVRGVDRKGNARTVTKRLLLR